MVEITDEELVDEGGKESVSRRPGVTLVRADDRTKGVEAVIRFAEAAMETRQFDETVVVSSQKKVSDGLMWDETRSSLQLRTARDATGLNEWVLDWAEIVKTIERTKREMESDKIMLVRQNDGSRESWTSDDLFASMFGNGVRTLHVWDMGDADTMALPSVDAEARRRGKHLLVLSMVKP